MSGIWQRFRQVTVYVPANRRIYRSSAPHYDESKGDDSQRLDDPAIKFLKDKRINAIISFNHNSYKPAELTLLRNANINYLHLPVVDFKAATLAQLRSAYKFVQDQSNDSGILVHCGYGQGRTGTGITGIQLQTTSGANPPEGQWKSVNGVEEEVQMVVLRQLRDSYKHVHDEL